MKSKTSSYVRWQKFFKASTIKYFTWFTGVIASKRFTRVIGSRLILITWIPTLERGYQVFIKVKAWRFG